MNEELQMFATRLTGAFLVLSLTLATTACGSGEEETATDGETQKSGTSSELLRVVTAEQYDLPMIGADAAAHLGIFKDNGLNVEVLATQDAAQALASGDTDVAIASPNRFIGAILQGLEAKIVGPTIDVWGQYVIVRDDLPAKSFEELKGGKIGISSFGSAGHFSAEKVAETRGWKKGDYEIVTLGNLDGIMAALRNGQIDMFMWSAQAAFSLEQEGAGRVLGNVGELIGPTPLDVIVVSDEALENRPEDIKAFCDSFYEAQKRFKNDPDLAKETYLNEWGFEKEVTPLILDAGLPLLSTDSQMEEEMFANMAEATEFTIDDAKVTGEQVKDMYVDCSTL
jgi:ABC-type nitrate/sulfonate/bicarbonate transport system substrate-binding protein